VPVIPVLQALHIAQGELEWIDEPEFTNALSRRLAEDRRVQRLWIADSFQSQCSITTQHYSVHTGLLFDISFSSNNNAQTPQTTLQLKLAGGTRPESRHQEPLHFLSDCIWSAIDEILNPGQQRRWNVAWLPVDRIHGRWNRLFPTGGEVEIRLDPNAVAGAGGRDDEWLDSENGIFQPVGRSEARFLLGKSTNPTVIGWYHRLQGCLSASFRVHTIGEENSQRIIAYELQSTTYNGEIPIEMWLP